jgi:type III pantothenate kinase
VGKDDITRDIQHICTKFQTPLFIAKSESAAFGLSNAYTTPSNMGVDRWLAMLACMKRSVYSNFLVVDIGTAMTIDAIQNGKHLGGWIVPGVSLLKQSLFKNTQKVFGNEENTFLTAFGNDTPACVNNGCTAQILGTLLMAEREMQKKVKKYEIFLTGGDKNIFSNLKIKNIIECENLVLNGLTLFVD